MLDAITAKGTSAGTLLRTIIAPPPTAAVFAASTGRPSCRLTSTSPAKAAPPATCIVRPRSPPLPLGLAVVGLSATGADGVPGLAGPIRRRYPLFGTFSAPMLSNAVRTRVASGDFPVLMICQIFLLILFFSVVGFSLLGSLMLATASSNIARISVISLNRLVIRALGFSVTDIGALGGGGGFIGTPLPWDFWFVTIPSSSRLLTSNARARATVSGIPFSPTVIGSAIFSLISWDCQYSTLPSMLTFFSGSSPFVPFTSRNLVGWQLT